MAVTDGIILAPLDKYLLKNNKCKSVAPNLRTGAGTACRHSLVNNKILINNNLIGFPPAAGFTRNHSFAIGSTLTVYSIIVNI